MRRMKLSDYLNQLERGGKSAFARKIGAHASDLSDWSSGGRQIPVRYCPAIERESGGAVTRPELRPTDWCIYWPELDVPTPPLHEPEVAHG